MLSQLYDIYQTNPAFLMRIRLGILCFNTVNEKSWHRAAAGGNRKINSEKVSGQSSSIQLLSPYIISPWSGSVLFLSIVDTGHWPLTQDTWRVETTPQLQLMAADDGSGYDETDVVMCVVIIMVRAWWLLWCVVIIMVTGV